MSSLSCPDPAAVRNHLRLLFGSDGGDAPGYLVVWTRSDLRTRCFAGDDLFGETPERIAALARTDDVYIGMGLQRAIPPHGGRGKADTVLALPGAWLDLDVMGPGHASDRQYPATRDEAYAFLGELPLAPSYVLDSGGGLQVHWLFRDLQVLATDADRAIALRLLRRVQAAILARGRQHGWTIDSTTADLARVLRPAGTLNWKLRDQDSAAPSRPVHAVSLSNARYTPADLVRLCLREERQRVSTPPWRAPRSDDDELLDALGVIPADDRDTWLRVGMALHAADQSEAQYQVWDAWSRRSEKYDETDQRRTWAHFDASGDVSLSTVYYLAQQFGWRRRTRAAS